MDFILASKSPRRREILENLGIPFTVVTADTDESSGEKDPCRLVEELSRRKGEAVRDYLLSKNELDENDVIIASDTVVYAGGEILGKPKDKDDAERMIRLLSGKTHTVTSGVALIHKGKTFSSHSTTKVTFDELDEDFIERYISSREPYDKAGAYAIQGKAAEVISKIDGCYFNVVGLPVNRLIRLARENGVPFELNS